MIFQPYINVVDLVEEAYNAAFEDMLKLYSNYSTKTELIANVPLLYKSVEKTFIVAGNGRDETLFPIRYGAN